MEKLGIIKKNQNELKGRDNKNLGQKKNEMVPMN